MHGVICVKIDIYVHVGYVLLIDVFSTLQISVVNNAMKIGLNELKLRFRTRLTTHFYDKYLR